MKQTMRRRLILGSGSALLAAGLALGAASAAVAAQTTWYNGTANINQKYTEGTAYQTRDGIKAGFNESTAVGQARITVWYGAYSNQCWAVECAISGPRTNNKGAFEWTYPGGQSGDKLKMLGIALNVGGMLRAENDLGDVPGDAAATDPLASAADAFSLTPADLTFLASHEGVDVWTASDGTKTYLFTVTGDGYATGASATADVFSKHGLTVGIVGAAGVAQQFTILPDANPTIDGQPVAGLTQLTDTLFVDAEFGTRSSDEVLELDSDVTVGLSGS
ncbi:hypothetical protein DCE93_01245 [Agromyces badenianii]|uniref:Uncharacterized protein n=1 Tax=Agromyces badenianii TaxID=2080742 RepID=A0A2S0WSZ3_9MICO|nr:hypothetical protein [Agromyces badenianii]AWB94463.1 hypothetical protein DCE93_01245 [Agromyces badenianii]